MKKHYTKYIIFAIFLLLLVGYLIVKQDISVKALLNFTPKDPIRATGVLLLLYAAKSATFVFPLLILEIATGHLFSLWVALGINLAGILIILTIPYLMGKAVGIGAVEKLVQKYPRFGEIIGKQQNNSLFLCFFLRIISCLPGDVVTMYFGATKTPFWQNLIGGTLGILPGMILATCMGSSIQNPQSPAFWLSAIIVITLSALSILLYYTYCRRLKQKSADEQPNESTKRKEMVMCKHWLRVVFCRRVVTILLIFLQVWFLVNLVIGGSKMSQCFSRILTIVSIVTVLCIVSKRDKGTYKTAWAILILSFPLFGGFMYVLFNFQSSKCRFSKDIIRIENKVKSLYNLPGTAYEAVKKQLPEHGPQIRYLHDFSGFPVYADTGTRYLTPGEKMLDVLLEQLKKAEKYIFLEYFIIQEGVMWSRILEVLKQKAAKGVIVRLIYDDMGCFLTLPKNYSKQMENDGIQCVVFNPFRPLLTVKQNNRDHRKIVVIDGKVAFTGGINLADEYINAIEKYGHWKDAAIMLEGKAAWSFSLIFLQMWELCTHTDEDYESFYPWGKQDCPVIANGFVQPYADSPMDDENVGEHVYLQILNNAKEYVYINTPYLIVDDSMLSALCLAAKSGVDIRIVTPHRWDKWLIHMTTRSYYRELIRAGVRIYEYTNGFIHSKTFVSDDLTATVGTTNLDFRSLYLHFECGATLYNSEAVMEVKEDFLQTLEICQEITEKDCKTNIVIRLFQDVLRLFAPLM